MGVLNRDQLSRPQYRRCSGFDTQLLEDVPDMHFTVTGLMKSAANLGVRQSLCEQRETSFSTGGSAITEVVWSPGSFDKTLSRISHSRQDHRKLVVGSGGLRGEKQSTPGKPRYADTKHSIIPVWVDGSVALHGLMLQSHDPGRARIPITARAQ